MTLITLSFLLSVSSYGSPQSALLGRAPYAIMHPKFNCAAYQKSRADIGNYGIAVLWNTFGHNYDCLNQELMNPDLKLVEVHLINGPCIRNSNCGKYEILFGYSIASLNSAVQNKDPALIERIRTAAKNLSAYLLPKLRDDQQCFITPILESNVTGENMSLIIDWIKDSFQGRCQFVWNPVGSSPGLPAKGASVSEGHGYVPVFMNDKCLANPDGAVMSDPLQWETFFSATKQCVASLGWTLNDNCLSGNKTKFIDPRARSCEDVSEFPQVRAAILAAQNAARSKN